jgi:hypothetical protein
VAAGSLFSILQGVAMTLWFVWQQKQYL